MVFNCIFYILRKATCVEVDFNKFDFSFRDITPKSPSCQYPNTVSSYIPTHNSLTTSSSRWNTRVALPDQSHLATRDMNTGKSPIISNLPSLNPLQTTPQLHEDVILAGGANRNHYITNQRPPTASWSSFRNRHMYQMQQQKTRGHNNWATTTSDEMTPPSSPALSSSEGEESAADTELMIHPLQQHSAGETRYSKNKAIKPQKPPRTVSSSRLDVGNLITIETSECSKSGCSKSSSCGMTPAPPPPPMPPIKSFTKNTRHLGHVTGITETLQNRMASAAVSAASEARARKVSKL